MEDDKKFISAPLSWQDRIDAYVKATRFSA